jgi:serine/threonine-protein kinase HipA
MAIAEKIGINVPPNILIELNDKSFAFLIKRFDRLSYNKKLHVEDFFQILEKDKYKGSYEQIGKFMKSHRELGLLQQQYYFERVVFNFIIGNADAHLKNFSILKNKSDTYILSPAYDLVSSKLAIPEEP